MRGDISDPGAEVADVVRTADAVLLSVPEPVALVAIGRLVGTLRPDALIADTLSVKSTVVPALHAAAMIAGEAEALSLNPMFAPVPWASPATRWLRWSCATASAGAPCAT